jgi:hypothetical protein
MRLYEQGVAAGERALGQEAFQRDAGHFWGILETRPYMRARLGLARSLWTAGRRDEAVRHLQDMLRLNPNDNQGVRYTLAGFLLFLDRDKALRQVWASERDDEDNARQSVATTVTFGEEWDIPVADLEAAKTHGWPVARADAYPEVFRKERGLSLRPPLAWELELMEGCLRAVPEFVARRRQDDSAREEITVRVASGELKLVLSWVVEEE